MRATADIQNLSTKADAPESTVLIIGAGIGGLFTGALLSRAGYRVTILEKNHTIGGGLQTFMRHGVSFDTGMHIIGGFQPGGALSRICRYLGIDKRLSVMDSDSACMDQLIYLSDGSRYTMARGRQGFTQSLIQQFPQEEAGIQSYVDALYRLTDEVDLYNLRPRTKGMFDFSPQFMMPADELIASYITDEPLRELLAYLNPLYGGIAGHTPAYIHALINVLHIEGAAQFKGGSQQLADALADVICQHGGAVLTSKTVTRVHIENRQVIDVETSDASLYKAQYYVSAIHPSTLMRLSDAGAFPKIYRERIDSIPNSYSAFSVYIIFKPERFRYQNYSTFFASRQGTMWRQGDDERHTWPTGGLVLTPPEEEQGEYAQKMTVICMMDFKEVKLWEDTVYPHRRADYYAWKQTRQDEVIDCLERLYPGIKEAIAEVFSSTPLTIRDFYHVKDGSLYGYTQDCKNPVLSQVPVRTKVGNLFLTGQNVYLHGICGVPLTAINTAEAILGENAVIDQLKR